METGAGRGKKLRMGDILVELGVITPEQLKLALKQPNVEQRRLGALLVALGFAMAKGGAAPAARCSHSSAAA